MTEPQWGRRMFNADETPQHYSVSQREGDYSPDRTWLVIGAGASERLTNYLNALEAENARLKELAALAMSYRENIEERLNPQNSRVGRDMRIKLRLSTFEQEWLADYDAYDAVKAQYEPGRGTEAQ